MKIAFTQSGGFAGAIRRCTLDTSTMPPDEAAVLEGLVRAATLASAPAERRSATGRDLEEYEIALEEDGASTTVVRDASTLTPEAKALVGYLKKCARPGAPG
ncbi:MAG: protealysin inhibitor emfourin [Vicinamibacterales bacterium]